MAYVYDVFFSYRRGKQLDNWSEKMYEKLEHWLNMELPEKEVKIFFDKVEIKTGAKWKEKIYDAIASSKCVVAILSPDYFKSKWCYAELLSFLKRSEMMSGHSLIFAASYHDGESFPDSVKAIQYKDFSPYAYTSEAFWDTDGALEFEKELKEFATHIAEAINKIEEHKEEFPIIDPETVETSITKIKKLI